MKRLHALLAIAAGLAVPSVPSAAPVFPRTPFLAHQLLEEPYPWRVPAASGKLNALIIAHSWTTPEFAEFAKRFDIRYDLVPVWSEESLERSWQSAETRAVWSRVTDLLARNRYDCILVTGYGDMPAAVWEGIYRQSVEGSAGLVFFNTGGPYGGMVRRMERDGFVSKADILQSPPVAAVSWTGVYDEQVRVETGALAGLVETAVPLGGKVVFGVRKGRARYVLFNWEKTPYFYWSIHHGISPAGLAFPFARVFPMADHIFALAAKAVFWSAGRTPAVRFAAVAPSDTVLASGARDAAAFSATVANGGRGAFSGSVLWDVRDEDGLILDGGRASVRAAPGKETAVALGRIPAVGRRLYLRCRLSDGKAIHDWATAHVEIAQSPPGVDADIPAATLADPEKPLAVRIRVPGAAAGERVSVEIVDGWSRLASRSTASAAPSLEVPVSLLDVPGTAVRVIVRRLRGGREIARAERFCTVARPVEGRYRCIRSDPASSTVTGWYLTRLNRLFGVNYYRTPGVPAFANALCGFSFGVYSGYGRINGPIAPDLSKAYADFVRNDLLPVKPYGASLFDFGDDTGLGLGLFRSRAKTPAEQQAEEAADWDRFTAYLKTVYRTPDELARSWSVPAASFAAVSRATVSTEQTKKNMVPLLDYRQYQEHLYAEHLRTMRALARREIPGARTTLNGYGDIGKNMEIVAAEVDSLVPYYRPNDLRRIRGILGREKSLGIVTGAYYGDETDKRFLSFIPWQTVLLGGNTVWLWGSGCIDGDGGFAGSTWPIFESAREIGRGVGELLARSEWRNDGVFIVDCPRSAHAQEMGPRLGLTGNSAETFAAALEELQIGYDFIGASAVAAGALRARRARAVILPYAVGLEPAAQEEIRRFVADGGIAIADMRPATRTPRGRPLPAGGLDDLFGVTQAAVADPIVTGPIPGLSTSSMVDASTRAASGAAGAKVGAVPILVLNRHGRGAAFLFNTFVGAYRTVLAAGKADAFTDWFAAAFERAGLRTRPFGRLPAGSRVFRYDCGGAEIVAFYREDIAGTPERCAVSLPLGRSAAVCDIRAGAVMGRSAVISFEAGKQDPRLFAVLSGEPPALTLSARGKSVRPGEALALTAAAPPDAPRLLRFEAEGPGGRPYPDTPRLLSMSGGRLDFRWATALNDVPAAYTLRITDVLTGKSATATVSVAGPPFTAAAAGMAGGAR